MSIKHKLSTIILGINIFVSFANSDIYFSGIGIEQGLSQLSVNNIYQDELGAMWFATREGLNRYNGNRMEVMRPVPNDTNSLGENLILTVSGDKNGHVFIRTQNGINVYDLKTSEMKSIQRKGSNAMAYGIQNLWIAQGNRLYAYKDGVKKLYCTLSQSKSQIEKILETSDQRLIIGTLSSGVFVIDQNKKIRILLPDCSQVSNIFEDSKKNIWISTWEKGLFKIGKDGSQTNYLHNPQNHANSISSDFVRVVCEDNNGSLWIGTKKGLDCLNTELNQFRHYNAEGQNNRQLTNESVWALIKDNQGTIWVGTYFGGVNYFNPDINFYTQHQLQNGIFRNKPFPIISTIVEDENENLYLCSEGKGLIYYNLKDYSYKIFNTADGLTSENIKAAWYDMQNKELWLATHLGGVCMLNTKTGKFTPYNKIRPEWSQTDILSSIAPYGNNLLAGTHGGLFLLDKETGQYRLLSEKLHKMVSFIQDVKTDRAGNIWVAGYNGVYKYNPGKQIIDTYRFDVNDAQSLSNSNASRIMVDSKGRIWIGTSGGGLNLYLPEKNSFRRYDQKNNGLINDFISNILESRFGYLIISTTKGFSMLDVENDKIRNFSSENGLPLNSLYSGGQCLTRKGLIYLSGMNGMVSFREENLSIPHRLFNLNLVNLWINNKMVVPNDEHKILKNSLAYTQSIKLNHRQTMITIEFASNNYIPANQPVYRYKLEGFSDTWTELPQGITKLNFMNLTSGRYRLIVQAISAFSKEMIAFTELDIRVYPPFYLSWYAFLLYILLIAFGVWRYIVFSRSRLMLEASLNYEKKEKEHLEEVNQSKLRFFTNISHEFRTPLTLIAGQVDMMLQTQNIQPTVYNRILSVKRNTLNMQNLINELLEFRKSEQGHLQLKVSHHNIVNFVYEVFLSFVEYANYRQIKFNFECREEEMLVWFDAVQMQKVFYNLISNAFKYTPKDGSISIQIEQSEHEVLVSILDSGVGISAAEIEKIFDRFYQTENGLQTNNMVPGTGIGLALSKNIVELHHAEIHVDSQPHVGSRFTVKLKKGSAHFNTDEIVEPENTDINCLQQLNEIDAEFMQEVISQQTVNNEPHYSMLIVEDNDELRDMLKQVFEPVYKIYTAVDGEEGLALTIEHQPDIVLSDVMMPRMSGTEMCSKIKNNFTVCHIPVVLLTAQTAVEHNIEGLRLGADDYVTKPFNIKTLITRCNNLVNGRKLLQERFSKQTDFSPRLIATNNLDREFLEKAQIVIEKFMDNSEFDVSRFASEMAMGRTKLFSKVKGITGQTPNDFILTVKLKKAASLLINNPEYNISDITYMLGFSSPKYFAKCFKEQFGVSPSGFRKTEETAEEMEES
jgi:signal transduction histidine kinase/ligand-binding sensor domain-containing protein/DNA-binding response OmpR family regulator